jgi:signal transduction histidine kinase
MITLQNRLTLTYALFISVALSVLTIVINQFTGIIFTGLIKDNIVEKSGEIVRSIGEQYNPMSGSFDPVAIETMGMYFVHEGYIVSVEDTNGGLVWDARSCDMGQCSDVIDGIEQRMKNKFGLNGALQEQRYPVKYNGQAVGDISIETYGPFFYSETETKFLASINRLLIVAGIVFILLSVIISIFLSRAIARPILKAKEAARQIARAHAKVSNNLVIRIDDAYQTKELRELSQSINELARELEEAERRQKQLSADIAHELRTPLTCLQGNIEAMIDGIWKPDKERLESCHEEIIRLAKLVRDLHTLTELEWDTITLNKTDFDLAKLLRVVAEQFMPSAREKQILLNLNLCPSPVNADYDRLKQVFINLLSNAVKYTDNGSVTISVVKGAKHYDVSIADTGIGIPEGDIPHVFERFYRSDKSRNRSSGGAGIGLAIAAAIVSAHDGVLSVESGSAGSVFTARL